MNDAFLATTALDDFWDTDLPVVFLNAGARRFSRRHVWKRTEHIDLAFDWPALDKRGSERLQVIEDGEEVLQLLTTALNTIHATNNSPRYWRILLSAWLDQYLTAVYERHAGLTFAANLYPRIKLTEPRSNALPIPFDSHEFALWVREDVFNIFLYSRVAREMGLSVEAIDGALPRLMERPRPRGRFATLRRFLNGLAHSGNSDRHLLMRESYFDKRSLLQLALLSNGRVRPVNPPAIIRRVSPDLETRRLLTRLVNRPGTKRLDVAVRLIASYLPVCFLEGLDAACEASIAMYPSKPKAIFTVNSFYYDEPFKIWAASSADAGTLLLGGQHGGTIGVVRDLPSVEYELSVTDRYYSWGHNASWQNRVACPMPATKFISLKHWKRKLGASKGPILYGTSTASRFTHLMIPSCTPMGFSQYLDWQVRFIAACGADILPRLRYRAHETELGWDIAERLRFNFPEILFDSPASLFRDSLGQCALFVCDYIGTIYAEAIAAGVPTLLFWDSARNPLTKQAQPLFDELQRVGILHETPESAARELTLAGEDFDSWWQTPERMRAARSFVDAFARRSDHAVRDWYDELKGVIDT